MHSSEQDVPSARTPGQGEDAASGILGSDRPPPLPREIEEILSSLWREILGLPAVGLDDNFFEAGGTSLLAATLLRRMHESRIQEFPDGKKLSIAAIFASPTIRSMTQALTGTLPERPSAADGATDLLGSVLRPSSGTAQASQDIAIIGMTGRFPGAASVEAFWDNLVNGIESITFFDSESNTDSAARIRPNGYVAARPVLENADFFDAAFFGVYPKEAEQMDPQHRVFLECAWEVLERAGYDPAHTEEPVGVFAGCSMNTYFLRNLAVNRQYLEEFTGSYQVGSYVTMLGNDKDFLATRVSYKLNLRGPSITVQTACSTSLVAVCQACRSLLAEECEMALAGAVSITFPQRRGYLPQEGGLASLDGHCRPFDSKANGTVFGHGAAVVLLKRLDKALRDGDSVLAVIRGCAVNNDGLAKVGYTAPSVDGQAQVISRALSMAQVPADSITYVEGHGTGTPLGDPIEVAALTKAFRRSTREVGFCALGAAKGNVGHLDVASGATGLIKTVLQMEHRAIPGLMHFTEPNPHLDLEQSPFVLERELRPWRSNGFPLRAGVSSFGVGGTNAHVIVEEPPKMRASDGGRRYQLFTWSAKTTNAAEATSKNLDEFFGRHPSLNPADAAYTLQMSRSRHRHRRGIVAASLAEARALLAAPASIAISEDHPLEHPGVVFCFPGQGVQACGVGEQLYRSESVFRAHFDACDEIMRPLLGRSVRELLYAAPNETGNAALLKQTAFAQPAIFAIEYALAQLWLSWGIRPDAVVGHSIGEYAAASVAGILPFEDAARLIAARALGMQDLKPGSMLSVRAPEAVVTELMNGLGTEADGLDLAAVNGPQLCVVSGADAAIEVLAAGLDHRRIQHRKLQTSHAFHSRMMEPALAPFAGHVGKVTFGTPAIPMVSTLTGDWISREVTARPESSTEHWTEYWTRQMREPVRFGDAVATLFKSSQRIFLEVGPGAALVQMIRQTAAAACDGIPSQVRAISSLPGHGEPAGDEEKSIVTALGRVWAAGFTPDWSGFHAGYSRKRILLPTYPFERKRFWVEPPQSSESIEASTVALPARATKLLPNPPFGGRTPDSIVDTVGTSTLAGDPDLSQSQVENHTGSQGVFPVSSGQSNTAVQSKDMLPELQAFLVDLSGSDLADAGPESSFLDLGFDSLFLTQLAQAIQNKYRLKLTFRQIMEDFPTLGTLAAHLEATVPAELRMATQVAQPFTETSPAPSFPAQMAPVPLPSASPAPGAFSSQPGAPYEALFASQVQMLGNLFAQQMDLLRAHQAAGYAPGSAPAAGAPSGPSQPATVAALKPDRAAIQESKSGPTPDPKSDPKPVEGQKPVYTPFKPLQRGTAGGLNATQETYLANFIARYNRRTAASKSYTQQHRQVFADGRVVSGFSAQIKELVYPLVVERASGPYLWDKDGNRYIDMLNGYGAILYGHSPEFIVEAVRKQLDLGFAIGPQTDLAGECAELIRELTGMERVTFCNTGSEAVMGAMRLARTVTGRNLVALFSGDYHGSFDEVLVKAVGSHRSMPLAPGIPRESVANILVLEYGSPESLEIIRQRANELAAVLVEPVQSRHPSLQPAEFLREVRQITGQSGSALIFDEVVTGFRTHPGGMQARFGIRADLATYGKVVAGGLPVGVLAGSPAYMDALDGGQWQYGDDSFPQAGVTFYAGTFMRHPLALAAVRASLLHIKDSGPQLQSELERKTADLVGDIRGMFDEFGYPSRIETFSSWFFFHVPTEPRLARLLHFQLREKGIHIQEGFPCFLTTAHSDGDLAEVRDAFRESLREMRAGQALGEQTTAPVPLAAVAAPAPISAGEPEPEPVSRAIPITEPQREILLGTQQGDEANCAFNESTTLVLEGVLDDQALIDSLESLLRRHEVLRATVDRDGETLHVAAAAPLPLVREDFTDLSGAAAEERVSELLRKEAPTPFDMHAGPLFRMRLVRLNPHKHMLIMTAHHIIFDGWSTNVFYGELSALYEARINGRPAKLGPLLTFHRYAMEQAVGMKTPAHAETEAYWLAQFKTLPAPLQLPTDRPRGAMRANAGATKRFVLPQEIYHAVRKAGAKQGSTLFATLLAAYAFLIHRLTQQAEIVVGIPMAGQSQLADGATLVGHCVNFLPILSRYSPEQTLAQFLKQTRSALLDAQDHQNYTYGTLLRRLKIPADPSRLQLVEVQFNLEQVGTGLAFPQLSSHLSANPKTAVNMDLFFNFVDRGSELWLDCDYNTGLFDASTMDRWFEHLAAILRAIVADVEQPAARVALLSPEQTNQILTIWNRTATDYPRDLSIHQLFERQAALTPDAPALIREQSMTYAELNAKANQLAYFLRESGVQAGDRVALCIDRSFEAVVSLLGILKAGAAYVPIDPSYPPLRIAYLVQDAQVRALISLRNILETLPNLATNVICFDADWPAIALKDEANPGIERGPQDLAYLMYTSGSTGNPKGVLVPHRAVVRLVKNNPFASFSSDERFLQLAPLSFDASTFEIWGALLNGARLVLGPAGRVAPEEIGRIVNVHGVTTLWLTAALFHLMVNDHLEALRPLRQLLAGGDVLSPVHVRKVLETLPGLRLINGYGPTENTTFTCCHRITRESLSGGSVPIGRPIANTRIYLLDAARKPAPPGVAGELYAAGDGLALGYFHAPEQTAEKFLEHTFENGLTERLYRTGDLACYRTDGTVEFLGRADTQVKIRGYRIELGEIEHALESSPWVRAAVVAVRSDWTTSSDTPGDKRLAAYVVPSQATEPVKVIQELRTHLESRLPQYMQPAAIVLMESLPRTLNGKVDRQALPAPHPEERMKARKMVYPRNPKEEVLADIWAKALGLKEVGVEESIFELGGDSLMIFRITTQANLAGLGLTGRHIFQHRTIAAICAQLEDAPQDAPGKNAGIQAVPRARFRKPQDVLQ